MNMTEKNGQPSMEEILASIRRIIAEEPGSQNSELRGTPIMLKGDGVLEDTGDFDLPAIFRSSPPVTDRQAPLLGRLTDAIRSATSAQPDGRGAASGEETRAEIADLVAAVSEPAHSYPALSSLRPVRPAETGPADALRPTIQPAPTVETAPSSVNGAAPMTASSGSSGDQPKRVMAAFKDTHFLRMSAPTGGEPAAHAAPEPPPAPLPPQPAAPVDFGAIIPGQLDRAALVNGAAVTPPSQPLAAHEAGAGTQASPTAGPLSMPPPSAPPLSTSPLATAPVAGPPPPLPVDEPPGLALPALLSTPEETGSIEDTTADLLRPMLRQWLADNMPRMVEKALHIEIAESVRAPKKP